MGIEREEEATVLVTGNGMAPPKRSKEDRVALPGCTVEGVNYCLECLTCRR